MVLKDKLGIDIGDSNGTKERKDSMAGKIETSRLNDEWLDNDGSGRNSRNTNFTTVSSASTCASPSASSISLASSNAFNSPFTPFTGPAICLKLYFQDTSRYSFIPESKINVLSFDYISKIFETEFQEYSRFSFAPEFYDGTSWVQVSGDDRLQPILATLIRSKLLRHVSSMPSVAPSKTYTGNNNSYQRLQDAINYSNSPTSAVNNTNNNTNSSSSSTISGAKVDSKLSNSENSESPNHTILNRFNTNRSHQASGDRLSNSAKINQIDTSNMIGRKVSINDLFSQHELNASAFHLELRARELSIDELGMSHVSSAFVIDRIATRLHEQLALIRNIQLRLNHIKKIMIFSKPDDPEVVLNTRDIVIWILSNYEHITVFVNKEFEMDSEYFNFKDVVEKFPSFVGRLDFWSSTPEFTDKGKVDLVITIGGDGTVLHASYVFQKRVPPVLALAMGSLGFLTNFDLPMYREVVSKLLDGIPMAFQLRMRLNCQVYPVSDDKRNEYVSHYAATKISNSCNRICAIRRHVKTSSLSAISWSNKSTPLHPSQGKTISLNQLDDSENPPLSPSCSIHGFDQDYFLNKPAEEDSSTVKPFDYSDIFDANSESTCSSNVLNEFVVDRGANPGLTMIELFADDVHVTTIQADGLVVATATGSTAYSLSAGGSLVHPEKHSILVTPICSHTLTTRPIHLPGNTKLRICISGSARASAWASFDGRSRMQLNPLDSVVITASNDPFLQIMRQDSTVDWFNSLSSRLHWNERFIQKPICKK